MAPPRRSNPGHDSSDENDEPEDDSIFETFNKDVTPVKYNNLAEELTSAIRQAEVSAARATSLALAASMKPAFSFNPSMPPPLPPGPDGNPYNETCQRCQALHAQNSRISIGMQNFRAMYTNLHRDYMQIYTAHSGLAEQNSTLVKTNAMLEEQARHLKKVTDREEAILNALRSFRKQRKQIRKEKGRRDRASQAQRVLTSFMEKALPEDVKIYQIDFTVEYQKDNGENVNDIYTLRDGKRTKIKNERESARIMGFSEPGEYEAYQQAKKAAPGPAHSTASSTRLPPANDNTTPSTAQSYNNPNLLLAYGNRNGSGRPGPTSQNNAMASPLSHRLPSQYGVSTIPYGPYGPLDQYGAAGESKPMSSQYSSHMPNYTPAYDILPPLAMSQAPTQDGQQAEALLRLSMARPEGLWSNQQRT